MPVFVLTVCPDGQFQRCMTCNGTSDDDCNSRGRLTMCSASDVSKWMATSFLGISLIIPWVSFDSGRTEVFSEIRVKPWCIQKTSLLCLSWRWEMNNDAYMLNNYFWTAKYALFQQKNCVCYIVLHCLMNQHHNFLSAWQLQTVQIMHCSKLRIVPPRNEDWDIIEKVAPASQHRQQKLTYIKMRGIWLQKANFTI
jgi:hypothetical protein